MLRARMRRLMTCPTAPVLPPQAAMPTMARKPPMPTARRLRIGLTITRFASVILPRAHADPRPDQRSATAGVPAGLSSALAAITDGYRRTRRYRAEPITHVVTFAARRGCRSGMRHGQS